MIKRSNLCAALLDKVVLIMLFALFFNLVNCSLNVLKNIRAFIVLALMFFMFSLSAQTPRKDSGANGLLAVSGTVVSAMDDKPITGVSVSIADEKGRASTKSDGSFSVAVIGSAGKVKFSHVGFKPLSLPYSLGVSLTVKLIPLENQLEEVEVVSTGYQKIPKERATGSFEFVDNKLLNRKVSTDFISRLEDVVPGIAATKISTNKGDLLNVNIRSASTLQSERWPLIVIDGVPYDNRIADFGRGLFNNINPNDIENVTILKDAAASSIWGAQSGNGVIVVTTKRGKFKDRTELSFNSNVTVQQKPDLYYYPQMNTSDYIDAQRFLFDKGKHNANFNRWNVNLQPILLLMKQQRDGLMSTSELEIELDKLRSVDMRDDFEKYIYRQAINQQYNLQLRSGGEKVNTLFSVGYDHNMGSLVTSSNNRLVLKSANQLRPVKNLLLDLSITYTQSKNKDSFVPVAYNALGLGEANYPYLQLADGQGNPLAVEVIPRNSTFRDTVAGGRLLDWKYRPLKELNDSRQTQTVREMFVNLSGSYAFDFGLKLNALYAYQRTTNPVESWRGIGTFEQRDLINYYSSWNADQIFWALPVGDYLEIDNWNGATHQGRGTMEFNRTWLDQHELSLLAGYEIREVNKSLNVAQYNGYNPETGAYQSVKYGMEVPVLNGKAGVNNLIDRNRYESFLNRYVSYYANGAYTFNKRYTLSASFRKDASNLFGVKSNDRGQPFWSVGGAWLLTAENFLKDGILSHLKLRATYGYNGNVNNTLTAYPVMAIQNEAHYLTGNNYAMMVAPPNPKLRWERVGNLNLGIDFAAVSGMISGSIEYYRKRPKDLIAPAQVDPTVGFTTLTVNSADLDTKGWDISVRGVPLKAQQWKWNSDFIFSYTRTKVVNSYLANEQGSSFLSGASSMLMTAINGMDLYSQLTYKWAGLNPQTGAPRGYVDGVVSEDYNSIVNAKITDLENHGSLTPLYYGAWRNTFRYRMLELSCNISYQLGHVFLRSSFNNANFIARGIGHSDYAYRWQKAGDELTTDVPAFMYPNNALASQFYEGSSALVENAGQIKLRDIQVSVNLTQRPHFPLKNCRVYAYIQNVGTLWRANKKGIDPEYGRSIPEPLSTSIGFSFNL